MKPTVSPKSSGCETLADLPASRKSQLNVLHVDGDARERAMIRHMLKHTLPGIRVGSVGTVEGAMQRLDNEEFDAILLDLMLPGYSALEPLLCLSARHPHIPIVVLTRLDDEDLAMMAVERGAQDYLTKSHFQGNELFRSLRYAIERQRRIRAEQDILVAQKDERQRLARELHDGVIQSLSAIKLRLQMELSKLQQTQSPSAPALQQLTLNTQAAIEEVRRISRDLHPSFFEQHALGEALVLYAREVERQSGLRIEVTSDCCDCLGPETNEHLYRIFQESLRNVVRHAHASHVLVMLQFTSRQVVLEIADNGRGFTVPAEGSSLQSLGIRSIRERAQLLHGVAEIHSAPGVGTSVLVKLPLSGSSIYLDPSPTVQVCHQDEQVSTCGSAEASFTKKEADA